MAEKDESELLTVEDRAFGRSLRDYRERRGITQGQLAETLRSRGLDHMSQVSISRIEQAKRAARLGEARAIAAVLGVPLTAMIAPASGVLGILHQVLDRPGLAVQQLDVAMDDAAAAGTSWAELRGAVRLIEDMRDGLAEELTDEPTTADEIDRYLREAEALLAVDPLERIARAFSEAHDAAAADADQ